MTATKIKAACSAVQKMLLAKNKRYGDSALNPVRIFSRASASEQIRVRIDDKLSRLARGSGKETEDVTLDLLGYLVLLQIAESKPKARARRKRKAKAAAPFEVGDAVSVRLPDGAWERGKIVDKDRTKLPYYVEIQKDSSMGWFSAAEVRAPQ